MIPYPWDVPGRIQGVDVSAVQPRLPVAALVATGIQFVIAKASDGEWDDHAFATHVADAQAAGLVTGAYHFFRSSDSPAAQMDVFVRRLESTTTVMRPVLDWEDTARIGAIGASTALDAILPALSMLQTRTGRRPIVYSGPSVLAMLRGLARLPELAAAADLWVAHYRWDPATGHDLGLAAPTISPPWTDAKLWQVGGNRAPRIPGVPFDVDRDVFFGDRAAFDAWCADDRPTPVPSTLPEPGHAADHALQIDAQKHEPGADE